MQPILVVQTGGTIAKSYGSNAENHGYNFLISDGVWRRIADRVRLPHKVECTSICYKDSLDLDANDRELIYETVRTAEQSQVIILHGTDTMRQTAAVLARLRGKTIILTGSMMPERFRDSDADFNVGMAIGALPHLEYGVHIALDGQVVGWRQYDPT